MVKSSFAHRASRLAAAAAFLVPFTLSISGTNWATKMHPDEFTSLRAMNDLIETGHPDVRGYIYPEGFYVLANIYRKVSIPFIRLAGIAGQEGETFRDLDAIRAPIPKAGAPSIMTGRRVNAFLAGLCGLFLFLAVRTATGSAIGGLCAMALGACSPFAIEHAHYSESDTAFCAGLALATWLLFEAIQRKSFRWTIAGAAASSAAFACKYTVAPIIPFAVAVYAYLGFGAIHAAGAPAERHAAIRRCLIAAALSLAAAIVAYAILTPLVIVDPHLFFSRILKVLDKVQTESTVRDAVHAHERIVLPRFRFLLRHFLMQLRFMGQGHIWLSAAATALLLARGRRAPCGPWLVALCSFFIVFLLSSAPWLRSQEFLPVAMLLGTIIAMAAGELHAMAMPSRLATARVAVPALCLAICCILAYGDAMRAARMFTTEDCRNTARHWLEMTSNPATRFAAGRFAGPTLRNGRITIAEAYGEAETIWNPAMVAKAGAPAHEYYVRQDFFIGRGFTNPITGERLPKREAGWTNFLAHATLLREWRLTPGYQTSFAQMPIGLWGIVPEGASFAVPSPLAPRATAYRMGPEHYDAAQGGDWLGPIEAIRTVRARKGVRFVPPRDGRPLYAVTRHAEGVAPARIKWEGCFWPRETTISPGRADWFIYKPSLFDGWGDVYVRTRVRMRGDDQTSLCLTTVTADPAYAAELLARGGSPDKAAEVLAAAGLPTDLAVAVRQAVKPIPSVFYKDFARIRFGRFSVTPGPETFAQNVADAASPIAAKLESEFPVLFDPGRYRVSFRIPRPEDGAPVVKLLSFTKTASQKVIAGADFAPGTVEMELVFQKPTSPHICGVILATPKANHIVALEDFTITWDPEFR